MTGIKKFFQTLIENDVISQEPANYDAVTLKVYIAHLEAENAELRARLEKAVELPCVKMVNPKVRINRIGIVNVIREWAVVYIDKQGDFVVEYCRSKTAAEEQLKEIKEKNSD